MSDIAQFRSKTELEGEKLALRRAQFQLQQEMKAAKEAEEEERKLKEEMRRKRTSIGHPYDL